MDEVDPGGTFKMENKEQSQKNGEDDLREEDREDGEPSGYGEEEDDVPMLVSSASNDAAPETSVPQKKKKNKRGKRKKKAKQPTDHPVLRIHGEDEGRTTVCIERASLVRVRRFIPGIEQVRLRNFPITKYTIPFSFK